MRPPCRACHAITASTMMSSASTSMSNRAPKGLCHRRSPGEPAVYAVQRRRDKTDRCGGPGNGIGACLTDQRRHERHQHGAEGRDVVGRRRTHRTDGSPARIRPPPRRSRHTPTRPSTHRPALSGRASPTIDAAATAVTTPSACASRTRPNSGAWGSCQDIRDISGYSLDCIAWRKA